MRSRLCSLIALLIAGAVVLAACSTDAGVTATRSHQGAGGVFNDNPTDSTVPRDYPVIDGVVDFGEAGPRHPVYDGYLTAAFTPPRSAAKYASSGTIASQLGFGVSASPAIA